jgi:glyoxylase-like metal-dependent hydrolase (beta-lactamase superfamily II)
MQIAPGLHRVECPIGTRYIAIYIVVGERHIAIVDTGFDQSIKETLVPYFEQNNLDKNLVRFAIVTHSDFDHSGGNFAVRTHFSNALICAGERDRPMIESLQKMIDDRYGEFATDHGFDDSEEAKQFIWTVAKETAIDIGLAGGERFDLGGRYLEVLNTPGHSWGHLSVLDETTGAVIIGDAVLGDTVRHADGQPAFPPTYRFVEAYRATIRALKARRPTSILAAHYPIYASEDGIDFLDLSLAYTDVVEAVTFETIAKASGPISLLEIIEDCHERLGPWPSPAYKYLVYPVMGHLEILESYRRIRRERREDGLIAWSANQTSPR